MSRVDIDLGNDHTLRFVSWNPDLRLNPQYACLIPWIRQYGPKYGAIVSHKKADGSICEGMIVFDNELSRFIDKKVDKWKVESWDPLTLTPSLKCKCGDHGFIRRGKWVQL